MWPTEPWNWITSATNFAYIFAVKLKSILAKADLSFCLLVCTHTHTHTHDDLFVEYEAYVQLKPARSTKTHENQTMGKKIIVISLTRQTLNLFLTHLSDRAKQASQSFNPHYLLTVVWRTRRNWDVWLANKRHSIDLGVRIMQPDTSCTYLHPLLQEAAILQRYTETVHHWRR